MTFYRLTDYFSQLEKTTLRNRMVEILSELFAEADGKEIGHLCYLLQGRVAPLYEPLEFGVADKMMIRAIAAGTDVMDAEVLNTFKETGDLGTAVVKVSAKGGSAFGRKSTDQSLTISDVYERLLELAKTGGEKSQEKKIGILAELIRHADGESAKYIVRMTLGKLRLGFSDMTILEGLSWMLGGDKSKKVAIEAAYNVRPDLGYIAHAVKTHGMGGLSHVTPVVGTPILMARANRLTSAEDIIGKIGKCAVEYKYDGLRLQVHYQKGKEKIIRMFSRNLEDITPMFPDIAEAVEKQIDADDVIFEGEVVAYNPQTGVFVPFQETMQRKRKYNIAEKAAEIPVKLFSFELLYCDGKDYIQEPYEVRKKKLKEVVQKGDTLVYAQEIIAQNSQDVEDMFEDSVRLHFEGIIAKRLDGVYEAGARSWNWIKFKKAMDTKLADTMDVVVMGFTLGEGKRTAFGVGQFLTGVYDKKNDTIVTLTKVGTGLTDEQFREFMTRVKKLHAKEKPPLYVVDTLLTPDVWIEPSLVVEIGGDEITRSAVHTAGRVMEPSKSGKAFSVKTPGYALRFPKLIRFRDDRRPEDATTVTEIEKLFAMQGR